MSVRHVRIHPLGGLGNRMLQLMFAEAIRLAVPDVTISGHDLPEWGLRGAAPPAPRAVAIECRAHVVPLAAIVAFMRSVPDVELHLRSVASRYGYYRGHRGHYAAMFRGRTEGQPVAANELAINIRLGDILVTPHGQYFPMPLAWYEQLIDTTGLSPVFIGQVGDDPYSAALRRRFRGARFAAPASAAEDFATLRGARNVAIGISTFAWLATWLSDAAEAIHLPIAGLYHPAARPDVDLLPVGDARYHFHQSDLLHWEGTAGELQGRIDGRRGFVPVSHEEVARRYAPHLGTEGLDVPDVPVGLGPGGVRPPRTQASPLSRRLMGALLRRTSVRPRA